MINIIITSFIFGVLTKQADLFNEHGLREPFKGAALLAGVSWGFSGAFLIYLDFYVGIFYTALILFWILRLKLEYRNHAIGGVLMLIASMWLLAPAFSNHISEVICIIMAYDFTRYLQSNIKSNMFLKLAPIRLYIIPFIYSCYVGDPAVFMASLFSLLGVKFINRLSSFSTKQDLSNIKSSMRD
jgi:hypothetical protein